MPIINKVTTNKNPEYVSHNNMDVDEILVAWKDAKMSYKPQTAEEIKADSLPVIERVGFRVAENDEILFIASQVNKRTGKFRETLAIPKANIVEIVELKR